MEGVWSIKLVKVDGVVQPSVPFPAHRIIFTADGHYIVVQGTRITHGEFHVDSSISPAHYDVTINPASAKSVVSKGLCELTGDTLTLCMPLTSKNRPKAVASKPGSGNLLHQLHREETPLKTALAEVGRIEMAGSWQAVSYELSGEKASAEDLKNVQLTIAADGQATARQNGKVFVVSTTTIDPSAHPAAIDFAYTEGIYKGQTSLGIFKMEDGLWTICRAPAGAARPSEFASPVKSGLTLMSYRRLSAAEAKSGK
jgi:uncharacterized protein (TIGR03067 family)